MPGIYEHVINVNVDTEALDSVDCSFLPPQLAGLGEDITNMIKGIKNNLTDIKQVLLSTLPERSITAQRESIAQYGSIVTGKLDASIRLLSSSSDTAHIGTDLFYAEYVEDGRGAVTAKDAKCLHFVTKEGQEIFTHSVGPADPRPYLTDSKSVVEDSIMSVTDKLITLTLEDVD